MVFEQKFYLKSWLIPKTHWSPWTTRAKHYSETKPHI